MKTKTIIIIAMLALIGPASAGCVCAFCNLVEDTTQNGIYYDQNGYPYRPAYAPDAQSEWGYFEDGTKIPGDFFTPKPSMILERMKNRQPAKVPFDPFAPFWRGR